MMSGRLSMENVSLDPSRSSVWFFFPPLAGLFGQSKPNRTVEVMCGSEVMQRAAEPSLVASRLGPGILKVFSHLSLKRHPH